MHGCVIVGLVGPSISPTFESANATALGAVIFTPENAEVTLCKICPKMKTALHFPLVVLAMLKLPI